MSCTKTKDNNLAHINFNGTKPKTIENESKKYINEKTKCDLLIYLDEHDDEERNYKSSVKLSKRELVNYINKDYFNVRINVTEVKSRDAFTNPLLNLRFNENTIFIEDNFICNIENEVRNNVALESEVLRKLCEKFDSNNENTIFVFHSIIDQALDEQRFKVFQKTHGNNYIIFIPIDRFSNTSRHEYIHKFHDRNIYNDKIWINIGSSLRYVDNYKSPTQFIEIPTIIFQKEFQSKLKGTFSIFTKYCTDKKLKESQLFIDFKKSIENSKILNHIEILDEFNYLIKNHLKTNSLISYKE